MQMMPNIHFTYTLSIFRQTTRYLSAFQIDFHDLLPSKKITALSKCNGLDKARQHYICLRVRYRHFTFPRSFTVVSIFVAFICCLLWDMGLSVRYPLKVKLWLLLPPSSIIYSSTLPFLLFTKVTCQWRKVYAPNVTLIKL